jgi:F-box interacting protein
MSCDINPSYLEFFSLRANQWKQIDEGTHICYSNATEDYREEGLLFNGVIHWFAYRRDLKKDFIVAFDLMERKFLEMNLPDEFDHELHSCGVWVFQKFLSLWAMDYYNNILEIWVMKEYKVHSSWTKTRVLLIGSIPTTYFSPITSTKGDDIFGLDDDARFVKYNDDGQFSGHHSYSDDRYVAMYTESLLSLPEDNLQP